MDNSDYRPIPGQTPLKLPPKVETITPEEPEAPEPVSAPAAFTPAPAPVIVNKLPPAPKFVSPMPKIEESSDEIPAFLPVIAGIATVVTLAFAVLIYLKR